MFQQSIQINLGSTWVKKYLDNENYGKWKLFFDYELQEFGGVDVFKGNLYKNDLARSVQNGKKSTEHLPRLQTVITIAGKNVPVKPALRKESTLGRVWPVPDFCHWGAAGNSRLRDERRAEKLRGD